MTPPELFPADYITEAIDQTRGWFYTLLATATLLGFGPPYKNVISMGHILDAKGEKMSKSKGNIVNPWEMMEKYGADAIRWYMYTINHPGDAKAFSENDLRQTSRRFLSTLWNSFLFYETYKPKAKIQNPKSKIQKSSNVLDQWILSKFQELLEDVTLRLDEYDITGAARAIEKFVVEEFSQWYIRRSRGRFQNPASKKEHEEAAVTLAHVLEELSKLTAPFIPFFSDRMHEELLGSRSANVHWEDWPKANKKVRNKKLEVAMGRARGVAAQGLAQRAKAGIKTRQPLALFEVAGSLPKSLLQVVRQEVNVKEVRKGAKTKLDTVITPELQHEGMVREVIRYVQEMRKDAGYKPRHRILLRFSGDKTVAVLFLQNKRTIQAIAGVKELREGKDVNHAFDIERTVSLDGKELWMGLKRL